AARWFGGRAQGAAAVPRRARCSDAGPLLAVIRFSWSRRPRPRIVADPHPCGPAAKEGAMSLAGLPKLVATDLDGTLVRSDETVSDYSLAVLRKVREAGIPVVGVTGRGARLIELCQRDLPEADFFVLAQGAYVVDVRDPDQSRVLRRDRIAGADLAEALRRLEEAVGGPLMVMVVVLDQ